MVDATAEFFEQLQTSGHEPLLDKVSGSVRFELENGKEMDRWFVSIDRGDVHVSHRNAKADCTVRTRKELFDRITRGEANAMASLLRGTLAIDGNYELLVLFQRLFHGPVREGAEAAR
jgi:putative sterol carrier protein